MVSDLMRQRVTTDGCDQIERDAKLFLREMFDVGIRAVSPEIALNAHLPQPAVGRTLVVAIGKAAASMAMAAHKRTGLRSQTIVVTRYGHSVEDLPPEFILLECGHPTPDANSLAAAKIVLEKARELGPEDMLLALISGGGSALLTLPPSGVSLEDIRLLNQDLVKCGAPISQINCVRKHVSGIAGGRLAVAAAPARVVTLALSDIPGDDIALIASGPTLPDPTTLEDARRIVSHWGLDLPETITKALNQTENETPFPGSPDLAVGEARIVARSKTALEAAGQLARSYGYTPVQLGDDIEGDAVEVATIHAALALHYATKGGKWALISGGETTVTVKNDGGRGGRNTQYALALALALDGAQGIHALACDTDGIDGTESNAGAVIGPTTLGRACEFGIIPAKQLADNDAYPVFYDLGDLIITGPTRTNVNDFRVILIDPDVSGAKNAH